MASIFGVQVNPHCIFSYQVEFIIFYLHPLNSLPFAVNRKDLSNSLSVYSLVYLLLLVMWCYSPYWTPMRIAVVCANAQGTKCKEQEEYCLGQLIVQIKIHRVLFFLLLLFCLIFWQHLCGSENNDNNCYVRSNFYNSQIKLTAGISQF